MDQGADERLAVLGPRRARRQGQVPQPGISGDAASPTKAGTKTVNGKDCVAIKTSDGTVYIDASTAQPVRVVTTGSDKGTLTFSKYDAMPAPPAGQTIDFSTLAGG